MEEMERIEKEIKGMIEDGLNDMVILVVQTLQRKVEDKETDDHRLTTASWGLARQITEKIMKKIENYMGKREEEMATMIDQRVEQGVEEEIKIELDNLRERIKAIL